MFEDLKEKIFLGENERISDKELFPLLKKTFSEPNFSLLGGESNTECQNCAIKVLKKLLNIYQGQKVAIGTHGVVKTLMMGYYDSKCDLNFLLHTLKPYIYKMEFNEQELVDIKRLWEIS